MAELKSISIWISVFTCLCLTIGALREAEGLSLDKVVARQIAEGKGAEAVKAVHARFKTEFEENSIACKRYFCKYLLELEMLAARKTLDPQSLKLVEADLISYLNGVRTLEEKRQAFQILSSLVDVYLEAGRMRDGIVLSGKLIERARAMAGILGDEGVNAYRFEFKNKNLRANLTSGLYREARADAEEAAKIMTSFTLENSSVFWFSLWRAQLLLETGEYAGAEELFSKARTMAGRGTSEFFNPFWVTLFRVKLLRAQGKLDEAEKSVNAVLRAGEKKLGTGEIRVWFTLVLSTIQRQRDKRSEAAESAREAETLATGKFSPKSAAWSGIYLEIFANAAIAGDAGLMNRYEEKMSKLLLGTDLAPSFEEQMKFWRAYARKDKKKMRASLESLKARFGVSHPDYIDLSSFDSSID